MCAFQVKAGDKRGFVLEHDDIDRILAEAKQVKNLSEVHIVSALHPDKPFTYYVDVVKQVKKALPAVDVKAFTPVEIVNFAKMTSKTIKEVLTILQKRVWTACLVVGPKFYPIGCARLFARKKLIVLNGSKR